MKLLSIIGARPQFIKSASINNAITKHNLSCNPKINEIVIHTGQHFDKNMSKIFFDEMGLRRPDFFLNINQLSHGAMTGRMIEKIEKILIKVKPDWVLIFGDTNSTLAGALAAVKLNIKIAHVESGLRSFNNSMPEEINRIIADRVSNLLFCPTKTAFKNLVTEGYKNYNNKTISLVGDVMYDTFLHFSKKMKRPDFPISDNFILATIHRESNVNEKKLIEIFNAFSIISKNQNIVLPIHPRTKKIIDHLKINIAKNITVTSPVGYLEMLFLLNHCKMVVTDSGGLQKEAYFAKKQCILIREETEWEELVSNNFCKIAGPNQRKIIDFYNLFKNKEIIHKKEMLYGDGNSGELIIQQICNFNK